MRTSGSRPQLLLDALQSLALQRFPCHAVVVVHGDSAKLRTVQEICAQHRGSAVTVLHAADTSRRRGYPINAGIDYCASHLPETDFLFLLDDDDIVYPFFTGTLADAFFTSEADVVYAASNMRTLGSPTEPAYTPKPIYHVFRENFIPTNSYAMRFSALLRSGVRMPEDLEYTEDWLFLLRLLEAGLRFHPYPAVLSEFRMGSDGNLANKKDPATWKAISLAIRRYINTTHFPIPGNELTRWAAGGILNAPAPAPHAAAASPSRMPQPDRISPDAEQVAALRARIWALENSLSWRCTAPLRSALGLLLGVRK